MFLSLIHLFTVSSFCTPVPQELRIEEGLIATIPEGIGLEGRPVQAPDGSLWPIEYRIHWSPDGQQVAYIGVKEGLTYPVIGEQVFDAYHYISPPDFGATGEQVLFRVGNRDTPKTEEWWIMLNGKRLGKEDWIGEVGFSPDGKRFAYWTQPGAKIQGNGAYNQGNQILVVAEKKGKGWKEKNGKKWRNAMSLLEPVFSLDGKTVVSAAEKNGGWKIILAGSKSEKSVGEIEGPIHSFAVGPSGKHWAATVESMQGDMGGMDPMAPPMLMTSMKTLIVTDDGTTGTAYDSASMPVFSPNGKLIAFKVLKGGRMGIAIGDDDEVEPEYDFIFSPVFGPKSKRIAYVVTEGAPMQDFWKMLPQGEVNLSGGTSFVIQHGVKGKRKVTRGADWDSVKFVTFSPDGKHLAYAAKSAEGWTIVLDEQPGEFFDAVGKPRFSEDGKQLGFGARLDRELWWKLR